MANKADKEKQKQIQEKCQTILCQLLREEDNKYCVDCDAKGPRWASWNLGIFLCIRCAGIHRNLGVHISRVKSVNLDTWTPEQVGLLQGMGNSKARAIYEANLPDNFNRPQSDSLLETFVRDKYEHKRFIAKEWYDVEEEKFDRKQHKNKAVGKVESPLQEVSLASDTIVLQQPKAIPRPHGTTNIKTCKTTSLPQSSTAESSVDLLGLDVPKTDTASVDLLGLDTADDPFDCLVNTTTSTSNTNNTSNPKNNIQSTELDEKDFFKQKAPAESQDKIILTKESILSLYTSGPTNGSWPSFGMPATGGVYAPQPMYQTAPMMGGFPPGGVLGTPNRMIGIPLQSNCVPQAVPSTNPFGPWGIGPPGGAVLDRSLSNPGQGTPRLGQIQNQMASLQLQGQSWNMMGNIQNQNPHAEHINLGSLSLGAPQPAPGTFFQAPTLSSSLWR